MPFANSIDYKAIPFLPLCVGLLPPDVLRQHLLLSAKTVALRQSLFLHMASSWTGMCEWISAAVTVWTWYFTVPLHVQATLYPSIAQKWAKARPRNSNGLSSTLSDCRWTLWKRRTSKKRRSATIAAQLRSFWKKYGTLYPHRHLTLVWHTYVRHPFHRGAIAHSCK